MPIAYGGGFAYVPAALLHIRLRFLSPYFACRLNTGSLSPYFACRLNTGLSAQYGLFVALFRLSAQYGLFVALFRLSAQYGLSNAHAQMGICSSRWAPSGENPSDIACINDLF